MLEYMLRYRLLSSVGLACVPAVFLSHLVMFDYVSSCGSNLFWPVSLHFSCHICHSLLLIFCFLWFHNMVTCLTGLDMCSWKVVCMVSASSCVKNCIRMLRHMWSGVYHTVMCPDKCFVTVSTCWLDAQAYSLFMFDQTSLQVSEQHVFSHVF